MKTTTEELGFTWSDLITEAKQIFKSIYQMTENIIKYCRRKKSRSCIWKAGIVGEPTGSEPQGIRSTTMPADWGDQPDENYQYRCEKMRQNIEREIAEEKLHKDALEILKIK